MNVCSFPSWPYTLDRGDVNDRAAIFRRYYGSGDFFPACAKHHQLLRCVVTWRRAYTPERTRRKYSVADPSGRRFGLPLQRRLAMSRPVPGTGSRGKLAPRKPGRATYRDGARSIWHGTNAPTGWRVRRSGTPILQPKVRLWIVNLFEVATGIRTSSQVRRETS